MKVLMLSWEYPPNIVGGLGQHVYDLSRFLAKNGVEVHIITPRIEGVADREEMSGVFIHRAGKPELRSSNFKAWTFYYNGDAVRLAVSLMSCSGPFDVIHVHDWLAAYAGRSLASTYRVPLVVTIHATEQGRSRGLYTRVQHEINEIEKNLATEAASIICCSQFMKKEICRQFEVNDASVSVIPNGVDMRQLLDMPEAPGIEVPEDSCPLVFLGRLVPEKGIDVLLNALARLVPEYPRLILYVCGRGPERERLEELAVQLQIDKNVVFTGFIERSDRNYLYAHSRLAVFPSLYEPFGIVALEAMAAGTPVIASDTGGLAEVIIDGENGLLFQSGDASALAAAIVRLLKDPGYSQKIAVNAQNHVIHAYDWNNIAGKTMEKYARTAAALSQSWTHGEIPWLE